MKRINHRLLSSTMHLYRYITAFAFALALTATPLYAQSSIMERLDQGLVAVPTPDGIFLSWRLLATDAPDTAFNLYAIDDAGRKKRLNNTPIDGPTWFLDKQNKDNPPKAYEVCPIIKGKDGTPTKALWFNDHDGEHPYLSIPLQTPEGYGPNDASVADLDGDGEYEIILHQAGTTHDNSHSGMTDPPIFQAYELDGSLLWQINLGINIRDGAHYTQFLVYDFDCDGKAEFVCKTADGTTDGVGNVLGDKNADYRDEGGRILKGPEYLTVFDGLTGKALDTVKYIPGRHPDTDNPTGDQLKAVWGDNYGNRSDRFLAAVAYLDGKHPSMVFCRGYYTRSVLAAFDFENGKIKHRWTFDSASGSDRDRAFAGQGNHNISVADVDDDGKDEIIYGSMAIDDDGRGLWSSGWGHGDALHVSDMDPKRKGLEVFVPHESSSQYGAYAVAYFDARTGRPIWGVVGSKDIGRGVAFDVDPRFPGYEMWASSGIGGLYNARSAERDDKLGPRGKEVSSKRPGMINFGIWWDGDPLREMLDGNHIDKWNWQTESTDRMLTATGATSNNGTKATPTLSGDLLGDWREEVILREEDGNAIRLYTTTIPTDIRLFTLMHDRQYRLAIAWQNVAYNQPPHPSFFLGHDMDQPDWPDITTPGRRGRMR